MLTCNGEFVNHGKSRRAVNILVPRDFLIPWRSAYVVDLHLPIVGYIALGVLTMLYRFVSGSEDVPF